MAFALFHSEPEYQTEEIRDLQAKLATARKAHETSPTGGTYAAKREIEVALFKALAAANRKTA